MMVIVLIIGTTAGQLVIIMIHYSITMCESEHVYTNGTGTFYSIILSINIAIYHITLFCVFVWVVNVDDDRAHGEGDASDVPSTRKKIGRGRCIGGFG